MAVISLALGVGLAAVAKEFVLAVLGTKWAMAIPFLQWLAICGAIRSVSQVLSGSILIVTGHERMSAMLIWFRLALAAPAALIAGHWWGIAAVPIAVTAASALVLPFAAFAATRAMPLTYRDIVGALWRPLLAAIAMTLAVRTYSAVTSSALLDLFVRVGLGAAVFLSALFVLWAVTGKGAGPERAVISLVEKRFSRS
jgi:O-antigen/teichoic acid export membrane protein